MTILQQLQEKLGRDQSDKVLQRILKDPEQFPVLMDIFLGDDLTGITMAGMTLGNLARIKPAWLQKYQQRIYEVSRNPIHQSVRRNGIRYFSELPVIIEDDTPLPKWIKPKDFSYCRRSNAHHAQPAFILEDLEGHLLDLSLLLVADVNEPAAPRAFAIQICLNLMLKYPEIGHELAAAIEETMEHSTAGFKNRGRRALVLIKRLT